MSPKPSADPYVGKTIAHYEIAAKLGGGGMGVVYKAKDTKLGRHVALKFLPTEWSHDEHVKQRFIREAQAASATDHPNICTVHGIESTPDDQLFIVMAYCEGQTLKEVGTDLGVSKERIRQLEGRALAKLREAVVANKIEAL